LVREIGEWRDDPGQRVTRGANLRSEKVTGQGHWERKRKNRFFCAYLLQTFIDLRQTKIKVINGSFCTYRRIHLISEYAWFDVNRSTNWRSCGGDVHQLPWRRTDASCRRWTGDEWRYLAFRGNV